MERAVTEGWIDRGFLITTTDYLRQYRSGVFVLPAVMLMAYYETWTGYCGKAVPRAMQRFYRRRLQRCLRYWYPNEPLRESIYATPVTAPDEEALARSLQRLSKRIIELLPGPP